MEIRLLLPMSPNTHPVRAFSNIVRSIRLPMCNSLKTTLTGPSENVRFDAAFGIIRQILTRMAEVFNVHLRRYAERRTAGRRSLICREFQADEVTCW